MQIPFLQETTSGTIQWGLAYLLNHPDVMCRVQAELDKVVGSQRLVNMSDRPELPYFNAVCNVSAVSNINIGVQLGQQFRKCNAWPTCCPST